MKLYSDFKHAGEEVAERLVIIELNWTKTKDQIEFLGKMWKTLDIEHQEQQSQILGILATKLNNAVTQVQRVQRKKADKVGEARINRWKYMAIKESIDKAIDELREWQKNFDPGWFLMLKIASPVIDKELAENAEDKTNSVHGSIYTARMVRNSLKHDPNSKSRSNIFLPKDEDAIQVPIPYSAAKIMQRSRKDVTKNYIVDNIPCSPEADIGTLTEDVRDLAWKLSVADPMTFGLLQSRGVVKTFVGDRRKPVAFDFVFYVPEGLKNPRSLRHILLSPDHNTSLSSRFSVARQLAQSVSYVHTYGFVHKNIRPDTILIFEDASKELAASFLLGFEKFRTAKGKTTRLGDCAWEKDLYRHPTRQGLRPEADYTMQHDIYSLGICLLEIGVWESFVHFKHEAIPSKLLPAYIEEDEEEYKKAKRVKNFLVELAKERLPSRMGDKYTEVVVNCLTCLDTDNVDFGDPTEFEDEDGVQIGVRYIEKVRSLVRTVECALTWLDLSSSQ
jgi:hypothetical protein